MNNPYIPNTSAIPNIFFDHWMEKLSLAEFKVLMCIARKTYGWHKKSDQISVKQMEKMTGMHRTTLIKNITALVDIGLVTKIKSKTSDGDDAPNRYEINVDFVGGGSSLKRLGVVAENDYPGVAQNYPQKKDYTKEKKEPPNPQKGEAADAAGGGKDFSGLTKEKKEIAPTVPKIAIRDHVHLTQEESQKLETLYGSSKFQSMLDILDAYKGASGKKYKSDYHVMLPSQWVNKRYEENSPLNKNSDDTNSRNREDKFAYNPMFAEIAKEKGEKAYLDYLKKLTDKKYYQEYLKSKGNS